MPIVNNSKFYVLGVNKSTKQVYIVCSWDEDERKVQPFLMKEKVGDKMLEEIITFPDYEIARIMASTFSVIQGSTWNFFPADLQTVSSLSAVILNYEGTISKQMGVISKLELRYRNGS